MNFQVTGGSRREGNSFGGGKMRENQQEKEKKRARERGGQAGMSS